MLAIAAAVVAAIGLVLDWADVKSTDFLNAHAFLLLAVLLLALHLAGIGAGWRARRDRV